MDWINQIINKMNAAIIRLGERLFPDMEERKRKRLAVRIAVGLLIALICTAGMGVFRYRAEKQLREYQRIADSFRQLDILLEGSEGSYGE